MSDLVQKWTVVSTRQHRISAWCSAKETIFRLPCGTIKTVWTKSEGKTVAVLPVTPKRTFILARQYRPGPDQIVDELPGGRCETGESVEIAARRELFEETGCEAERWICLGQFLECAYSTVERWGFIALNVREVGNVVANEHEPVQVVEKTLTELVEQLCNGLICDPEVAWAGLYRLSLVSIPSIGSDFAHFKP